MAVQIVYSWHRGSREIEHIGSAHDAAGLELLKSVARQRLAAGQGELDLGLDRAVAGGSLPITASRMSCLLDALSHAYRVLGFDRVSGGDAVFGQLVAARIIEPVSKADSLRVLEEAGVGRPVVCDAQAPPARLCEAGVAAGDLRCLRRACRAGPGQPGALRRVHALLRDR